MKNKVKKMLDGLDTAEYRLNSKSGLIDILQTDLY